MDSYKVLEKKFKQMNSLGHLISICYWDQAAMMPDGGAQARGEAIADVEAMRHSMMVSDLLGDHIKRAQNDKGKLSEWQVSNLNEMTRQWRSANCLESQFVEELSIAGSQCGTAWRKFRPENNWTEFLPYLDRVIELKKRESKLRSEKLGQAPYDTMIEMFEPGQTANSIAQCFDNLKSELPVLIDQAIENQEDMVLPKGKFAIEKQRQLGLEVMKDLGFDFNHGRLDISAHPFCGGVPRDVRITTRYRNNEFIQSLMGIIHETGHARYEQNLPQDWVGQPVGEARGMGIHEGQSLLFENQMGHSSEFIHYLTPKIKKYFGDVDPDFDWSPENLVRLLNRVEKGFIRVEADELTYPMHVILRFEIERMIFDDDLKAADLPSIWNEKMRDYLGLSTEGNYKNGVMQDMHWPEGAFGYFPSYTLGAMNAAQLFTTLCKQSNSILQNLMDGNTEGVNSWLQKNIWSKGSLLSVDRLIESATGETLNAKFFIEHLKNRYL